MRKIVHTAILYIATVIACVSMSGCSSKDAELEELKNRDLTSGITYGAHINELALAEDGPEYTECTLSMACSNNETVIKALQNAIVAFEKEYPGIYINLVTEYKEPSEETEASAEKITEEVTDIGIQDINEIDWEILCDNVSDTVSYYDLYKEYEVLNLGAFGQEYLNMCTFSDSLQALPISISGKVFAFNKSVFDMAGIDVPKSLEELMASGVVFEETLGSDYYPLAVNIDDRIELLLYYLQSKYGREWTVNGVLQYSIGEIEEGLKFLTDLEEAHVIPTLPLMRGKDEFSRDAGWASGNYAGVFVSSSDMPKYETASPVGNVVTVAERFNDMGIFDGGYVSVETAFAVSDTCSNPREAALFLNYILNCENGVVELKEAYGIPLSRIAKTYGEEQDLWNSVSYDANVIAEESDFLINDEYRTIMKDTSILSDIIIGISYGDYNVREAAQIFMGSF